MTKIAVELTPNELSNTQSALELYLEVICARAATGDDEDAAEIVLSVSSAQRACYAAGAAFFSSNGSER